MFGTELLLVAIFPLPAPFTQKGSHCIYYGVSQVASKTKAYPPKIYIYARKTGTKGSEGGKERDKKQRKRGRKGGKKERKEKDG